jgi:predicted signal transduction protein with EAL and GGDEF domain
MASRRPSFNIVGHELGVDGDRGHASCVHQYVRADPIRQALVAGMLHFAGAIGVEIIAEGVETEAERLTIQELGVAPGQGFLFASPAPARAESRRLLSDQGGRSEIERLAITALTPRSGLALLGDGHAALPRLRIEPGP